MKSRLLFGLALLTFSAGVCADATQNSAAEKEIRAALARWGEAANRGDFKAALDVWAPDLIGWAPEGPDDNYRREAESAKLPLKTPKTTYQLAIDEVIVDGSLAVVRDTWTETTKRESAPDVVSTFRSYEVWRRQPDATWKISRWIDGPVGPKK